MFSKKRIFMPVKVMTRVRTEGGWEKVVMQRHNHRDHESRRGSYHSYDGLRLLPMSLHSSIASNPFSAFRPKYECRLCKGLARGRDLGKLCSFPAPRWMVESRNSLSDLALSGGNRF